MGPQVIWDRLGDRVVSWETLELGRRLNQNSVSGHFRGSQKDQRGKMGPHVIWGPLGDRVVSWGTLELGRRLY